jgi:hypothetical protein
MKYPKSTGLWQAVQTVEVIANKLSYKIEQTFDGVERQKLVNHYNQCITVSVGLKRIANNLDSGEYELMKTKGLK